MTISRLELPAFYIDEIIFDSLGLGAGIDYLQIVNRSPEPGEEDVRIDSLISFDIAGSSGNPPILADTTISIQTTSINGVVGPKVVMYNGAGTGFQAGFNGTDSSVVAIDSSTTRFVIDPTLDFDSESTVKVFVETRSSVVSLDEQRWSFIIEDVTAPILESVTPREKKVIRVVYDEPMNQTSTDSGSVLNLSNYTFTQISVPSVPIEVESIEIVTTNEIDITIDVEMTPGASYQLVITDVEDLLGNVILSPTNSVIFVGFQPEVSGSRSFDLWDMLPKKNRIEDIGDLFRFISCLQEVTNLLLSSIDEWTDILDPDRAPEIFVDAMLDDLANPFEFDLDLVGKRKLIRILVEIYRQKGTGVGIINVVRFFLGIEIEINAFSVEGWDLGVDELGDSSTEGTAELGPGTSFEVYSFEIVSPIALTDEQRSQIESIANYMKPAHTHLIQIVEPEIPEVIDHIELGLSELGNEEWLLH